jgi:hypothetical protein
MSEAGTCRPSAPSPSGVEIDAQVAALVHLEVTLVGDVTVQPAMRLAMSLAVQRLQIIERFTQCLQVLFTLRCISPGFLRITSIISLRICLKLII